MLGGAGGKGRGFAIVNDLGGALRSALFGVEETNAVTALGDIARPHVEFAQIGERALGNQIIGKTGHKFGIHAHIGKGGANVCLGTRVIDHEFVGLNELEVSLGIEAVDSGTKHVAPNTFAVAVRGDDFARSKLASDF